MADHDLIFKTLKANGWVHRRTEGNVLHLDKRSSYANLYPDFLEIAFRPNLNFVVNQHIRVCYRLADIQIQNGKLILPEIGDSGPYCG